MQGHFKAWFPNVIDFKSEAEEGQAAPRPHPWPKEIIHTLKYKTALERGEINSATVVSKRPEK